MKSHYRMVLSLFALAFVAGCATTKVTNQQQMATGEIPRPKRVLVYDFAATAGDMPANSALAGQYSATPQTAEQIAMGRQLGAQIAAELVQQIQSMGMPAARGGAGTAPQINDIVLQGYLLSVNQGSAAERLVIGFGAGASELRTAVEGYQITPQGPRKLGSGTVDSGGSKSPGAILGIAGLAATGNPAGLIISTGMKVYGEESGKSTIEGRAQQTAKEIAAQLKTRFQEQGWI